MIGYSINAISFWDLRKNIPHGNFFFTLALLFTPLGVLILLFFTYYLQNIWIIKTYGSFHI